MTNIKFSNINTGLFNKKALMLSVVSIVSVLTFSMASTASAATLTRQLEVGMTGGDVASLQTFLAQDYTIYPQGLVTSYFGSLTKTAVSNFQARNGIAVVGRVGPITMVAINAQMNNNSSKVGIDRVSPAINSLNVSPSSSSASFNWNTSENASAIIYYSTASLSMTEASSNGSVNIGGNSYLVHTDLRSSHSATLTGLQTNTTYYFVVYVRDGNGNESITWPSNFKTSQ